MAGGLVSLLCLISIRGSIGLLLWGADSSNASSSYSLISRRFRHHLSGLRTGEKYVPGSDGTYSQNYQDKWIAAVARRHGWDKPGGFFLDLGAFDGLKCSNSALIEKSFGWKGVCVEPRPVPEAFSSRNCLLVTRAMSQETGRKVRFFGKPGTQ